MAVVSATPPLFRQLWRPWDVERLAAPSGCGGGRGRSGHLWAVAGAAGFQALQVLRSKADGSANGSASVATRRAMRICRVSLMAQAAEGTSDEEAKKLWQEAYAIEVERAERLQSPEQEAATLPTPPQSGSAAEWQAAYEALKAQPKHI